jgi:hypothetical protein
VRVDEEAELSEATWQLLGIVCKECPLLCPTRVMKRELNLFSLRVQFRSKIHSTILDYVKESNLTPKATFDKILWLMMNIAHIVADLHAQGLYLCAPIEYCFFVNLSDASIVLFHLGLPQATYHRISYLLNTLEDDQLEQLYEYYPVEEILDSKGKASAFEYIDNWMISKSF